MLKSFICTQKNPCHKLKVWTTRSTLDRLFANKALGTDRQKIEYNSDQLWWMGGKVVFQEYPEINVNLSWPQFADKVRFELMYKYGGVWVDMDTIFLRDWTPILSMPFDFVYRWSFLKNINTAVLRVQPHSWLREHLHATSGSFHPKKVGRYCSKSWHCERDLYILPNSFFDTWWMWMDGVCKKDVLPYPFYLHKGESNFGPILKWWTQMKRAKFSGLFTIPCPQISRGILKDSHLYSWLFGGSFSYHWHGHRHQWNQKSCASQMLDEFSTCIRELT